MTIEKILLDHGSGGKAIFELAGSRLAFSTDSYTVDPIFFPGGNIGDLAINGTVNDIAMCGATPLYLSVGLIIEEGLSMTDLETIINDMGRAAEAAGVIVITGDTKVVPRGTADRIFINTSGIGLIPQDVHVASDNAKIGDKIILSGTIADHGITILTQREGLSFETSLQSDSAPLNHMTQKMFSATAAGDIHVLRDPTRGGVGTALNEIAEKSEIGIEIIEDKIPLKDEVACRCGLGSHPIRPLRQGCCCYRSGGRRLSRQSVFNNTHRRQTDGGHAGGRKAPKNLLKSDFKTASNVRWLRFEPLQNARISRQDAAPTFSVLFDKRMQ
jgi:hydrogenase expression/formation protein HypE